MTRPTRLARVAIWTTAVALAGCVSAPASPVAAPALKAVPHVELERYVGTWNEIARYPFGIQDRRCARETTATYRALAPDRIAVVNRCLQSDGTPYEAEATAWIRDTKSNAKLEVSFLPAALRWLPLGRGDYWVIDLAPDYSWAVVGEPRRRYLWILARSPQLPADTYRAILDRLPAQGYDPARVLRSPGR